eukprot:761561-Hanusia_phi.AAC.3
MSARKQPRGGEQRGREGGREKGGRRREGVGGGSPIKPNRVHLLAGRPYCESLIVLSLAVQGSRAALMICTRGDDERQQSSAAVPQTPCGGEVTTR